MKASEAIERLIELKKKHGDLDITSANCCYHDVIFKGDRVRIDFHRCATKKSYPTADCEDCHGESFEVLTEETHYLRTPGLKNPLNPLRVSKYLVI